MLTFVRRPRLSTAWIFTAGLVSLLAAPTAAAGQQDFTSIVVFGDSLSDSGNAFALVKESGTPPDYSMGPLLVPRFPYARGGHHLSNGATWIEQLARSLGLARSVQPAFRSASPHAMNFAIGGARARDDGSRTSLPSQLAAFFEKTGGTAPSDALYVIQVGGNDVRDALAAAASGANPEPILLAAVSSIASTISTLYAAGARNFLVWTSPDIGLTPAVQLVDSQAPGTAQAATFLSQSFNAALAIALTELSALPGISIVPFDAFSLLHLLTFNPAPFGLTNVTDACVSPDDPPFVCRQPDTYLYWDGIHPTAAVHAIIAREIAGLLLP